MKRNFGLDVLRSISIWMVLLQHLGADVPGLSPLRIGGVGVEIFFVLSGFLIGGILFKEISKGNSLIVTLKSFWLRRWFRILPLYYAALLFKFVFIDSSIGSNIIYYIFFLQNNFYGIKFMSVSWSLVIEEWFYLFAPLFLYFVIRILKTNVITAILFFIAFVIITRTAYVYYNNVPFVGVNGNFPFRFDSLFLGVLLSYINMNRIELFNKLATIKIFLVGLILFFGYLIVFRYFSSTLNAIDEHYFFRTVGFFVLAFSIMLIVPFFSKINFINDNPTKKFIYSFFTTTSIITYAMYLSHPFINSLLSAHFSQLLPITKIIVSLSSTYLVSWIIYTYFERPILNLRDKF